MPIPFTLKKKYLEQLLSVGFDVLDMGSFVSPQAIPQMADTAALLEQLSDHPSPTRWLVIVANQKGARMAVEFARVGFLGYPFSLSETFMHRNANRTIDEALADLREIQSLCHQHQKHLVAYLSMGFGNPYGEAWSPDMVLEQVEALVEMGIGIISLSDTVATAHDEDVEALFARLTRAYPQVEFGAHLHARPNAWMPKIEAAYAGGCRRFDGALKGYGGCPMAEDELVGNIPTEALLAWLKARGQAPQLNEAALQEALELAGPVFAHA